GPADFQFRADDLQAISATEIVSVTVSAAPLVNLDFQQRAPRLGVGGFQQVVIVGDFADQKGVVLGPHYGSLQSTNQTVAALTADGHLVGVSQGTSVLTVSALGLQAATAVTVGVPQDELGKTVYDKGLDLYPLAVSLNSLGGTRQFVVHPFGDVELTTDLST